jgi:hypothetical protein
MAARRRSRKAHHHLQVTRRCESTPAHYYAELARTLEIVDGATFVPSKLTVVTLPWNPPLSIPAG